MNSVSLKHNSILSQSLLAWCIEFPVTIPSPMINTANVVIATHSITIPSRFHIGPTRREPLSMASMDASKLCFKSSNLTPCFALTCQRFSNSSGSIDEVVEFTLFVSVIHD